MEMEKNPPSGINVVSTGHVISGGGGFLIGVVVTLLVLMFVGADFSNDVQAQEAEPTLTPKQQKLADEKAASEAKKEVIIESQTGSSEDTSAGAGEVGGLDAVAALEAILSNAPDGGFATIVLIISAGGDVRIGAEAGDFGADLEAEGAEVGVAEE